MKLQVGTYSCPVNGVDVGFNLDALFNEARVPYGYKYTVAVKGELIVTGQANNVQAESALQTALTRNFQGIVLLQDSGAPTTIIMPNLPSLSGVTVSGIRFPGTKGGQYATNRSFEFTASADYALPNTNNILISFTEEVSFGGGYPIWIMKRSINTVSQRQQVYPFPEWTATQSGSAVGFRSRPKPPPPMFPQALKEGPKIRKASPKRVGPIYRDFLVSWSYAFESVSPLVGEPNLWPLSQ
jgi:hypothetical protein